MGSVVTWGGSIIVHMGIYKFQSRCRCRRATVIYQVVIEISLLSSFAALKDDGSVVTWGDGLHYD